MRVWYSQLCVSFIIIRRSRSIIIIIVIAMSGGTAAIISVYMPQKANSIPSLPYCSNFLPLADVL